MTSYIFPGFLSGNTNEQTSLESLKRALERFSFAGNTLGSILSFRCF